MASSLATALSETGTPPAPLTQGVELLKSLRRVGAIFVCLFIYLFIYLFLFIYICFYVCGISFFALFLVLPFKAVGGYRSLAWVYAWVAATLTQAACGRDGVWACVSKGASCSARTGCVWS